MTSILIEQRAKALESKLIELRRYFHQNPELSHNEFQTSEAIAIYLSNLGLDVRKGIGKTGVVGILSGSKPGPCIAMRADIDALPVPELNNKSYCSKNQGISHACGHDAHIAISLGVAEVLCHLRNSLNGTIKFIFQPAEEISLADSNGGAYSMIHDGVLENPTISKIYALHVMPTIESGYIGYNSEAVWASNDMLEIIVKGKKTHGAYPHTGIDSILVASHIFISLQNMISRSLDAQDPFLISFGVIEGGNQFNVLPDRVRMAGMFRALSPEVRRIVPSKIKQILDGITTAFGADYELNITPGVPVTINNAEMLSDALLLLKEILGTEKVLYTKTQMGAEDFSLFAERVPALYLLLGVGNKSRGITSMLHTPEFDIDESSLVLGVNLFSQLISRNLL